MTGARRVVFGLGSNVGDRGAHLAAASAALAATPGLALVARSRVFETPPAGGPPQGDYLNAAVLVESALSPAALLSRALAVELELGRARVPGERNGPRTIDVDLLWIEGERVRDGDLEVPHPRLASRPFAVQPLVDVAPDAADPETGARYADLPAARTAIAIID